jgi:outer membrane lipoprotein SlyB
MQTRHAYIYTLLAAALLAGCAASYRPLVDTRGVDPWAYERDLTDCRQYAQEAAGPGTGAALGAIVGALLGAAISHAAGSGYDHGAAARVGAVAGAAGGAGQGAQSEIDVIRRCMQGRGYSVLQ